MLDLQQALLQLLQTSILLPTDVGKAKRNVTGANTLLASRRLPRAVVRGSILARCNSLVGSHSAVRIQLVQSLLMLLNLDCIPVLLLRGSISF